MLHLVINPTAGNGRAARVGQQVVEKLERDGVACSVSYTERVGHATELARSAAEGGAETVIAVGGDGTVLETARGIHGTGTALGIVPAGTGNDVVKMLDIPRKPMEALDHLLARPARSLDAGHINDKLFLNVCGTGFDVAVLENSLAAKRLFSGMLPYLWGVIRTIFTYKPVEATIEIDGEVPFTQKILLLAIANGRFIGGGMEVAPSARPDDGLFDVVIIDNMPKWKLPPNLPKLLSGNIRKIPGTVYRNCRRISIAARDMRMNIDGEIVPMERVSMEILPASLLVRW